MPLLLRKSRPLSLLPLLHHHTHGPLNPTRPAKTFGSGSPAQPPPRSPLHLPPLPYRLLHHHLRQIPPLLPRAHSLPSLHPLPLLNPNPRSFSSSSESDADTESDPTLARSEDVDRVYKVIDDLFDPVNRNMEAVLDEIAIDLGRPLVIAVLHRFQHAHKPAYRFFRWAWSRQGFSRDPITCSKMLSILGKCRQFETMVDLLEEMGTDKTLSMDAFMVSIRAFASAREMNKAIGIFKLMKRFDFEAGMETFNCLIDALAKGKLVKEANELVEKMKDQYPPDLRTYSLLLFGWCKVRNVVEAGRVWNEMLDSGFKPDLVAHNTMLDGLIRGQWRVEAIKFFQLMKSKGPKPNARTYTILIQDLCKAGKMDRAVACFEEMVSVAKIAPEVPTYTCLIVGFGNARQMEKVSALLKEMHDNGCLPDAHTYNALIKLMTNRNMPDDAARIYKKMIQKGFKPTIHTYNMMMKSYFRGRNYEMACATWEEMGRKGVCPDVNSYTVFIEGLIRHGRVEEACKCIEEMINKGMKAPHIDYNKFSTDFARAGRLGLLRELAQKMKPMGEV